MLQILLQVYKFVWGSGAVRETKWYFPNQHILKPLIHARYSFSRYSPSACCVPGMREMEAAMLYKKKTTDLCPWEACIKEVGQVSP